MIWTTVSGVRTALDRIDYGPGVIIQHTAPGQTSPYIRGLTGKQSLLLFDGVRLSHGTMRGGPNQYFALIPDVSIDSIDVILGSSSVVNGSDGLTGALDVRLAQPGRDVGKAVSPWVSARVDSANGSQTGVGIDGMSGNWRYSIEGLFCNFHDRVGGKDADRGSSGTTAFGNPDLDPEVSYTGEAGWRYARGRDQLGFSAFYTLIDDVIQTVYPGGGGSGSSENGKSAYLQGLEMLFDYGLPIPEAVGSRLALVGSVSLVDSSW